MILRFCYNDAFLLNIISIYLGVIYSVLFVPVRVDFLKDPLLTCIGLVELGLSNSILIYDYLSLSAIFFVKITFLKK